MLACKKQIKQEISETLTTPSLHPKILKYIELFNAHVDSSNLVVLYHVIQSGNNPSDHLLSVLVDEAQTNNKLLNWIEVLLRQF
jgi:hypothetical protein